MFRVPYLNISLHFHRRVPYFYFGCSPLGSLFWSLNVPMLGSILIVRMFAYGVLTCSLDFHLRGPNFEFRCLGSLLKTRTFRFGAPIFSSDSHLWSDKRFRV